MKNSLIVNLTTFGHGAFSPETVCECQTDVLSMHGNRARPSTLLHSETLLIEDLLSLTEETRHAVNLHKSPNQEKISSHSTLKWF